ncbi:hypothetical protein ABT270_09055 [Streptomyces sp900105245]|uniref:hypothetical protein n=1 Tax=Streptomyces sp. 900105245 TaxID=3154379 RepID=UPI003320B45C
MNAHISAIALPVIMLILITGVALGRRHFHHPSLWLLAASAGLAGAALTAAVHHSHHSTFWMALSGTDFVLALTVNRHRDTEAPQPSTQAPTSLTKDETKP